MVHRVTLISWRAPWGATPIALVHGRIAGIALDGSGMALVAATERRLSRGAPLRSTGPIRTAAAARALLDATLQRSLPARKLLAACDLRGLADFDVAVLRAIARVPHGATATYGEIAAAIGSPRAARAVGGALGRNPIPVLLPCHRVVAAAGIGGYGGAAGSRWRPGGEAPLDFKRRLLQREGVSAA
ncbi:MAG: methylated-DNA--[protein]-cysteine S-methyltransferase [Candidatus Limnocylindrus sp.]|jgi:methylated-DNA-[protein]-cysteine S-methyltransferase